MNIENRCVKIYLKNIPPHEAYDLLDKYLIPSPYKEILISVCILNKNNFQANDYIREVYNINMSDWTFSRRLKDALVKFKKSSDYFLAL